MWEVNGMKLWMKKIAVAIIAIATLGMYTPTALLEVDADENKNDLSAKADYNQETLTIAEQAIEDYQATILEEETDYLTDLQEQARIQSLLKFGPRIAEQVEDEFTAVILPKMEAVLENLFAEADEEEVPYYGITENPAKGYGERIFNVSDLRNGEELARFHVRRDNRPLDGHYFNFHYHLSNDNFKAHHNLGEIYWDKNTPPKWMA